MRVDDLTIVVPVVGLDSSDLSDLRLCAAEEDVLEDLLGHDGADDGAHKCLALVAVDKQVFPAAGASRPARRDAADDLDGLLGHALEGGS